MGLFGCDESRCQVGFFAPETPWSAEIGFHSDKQSRSVAIGPVPIGGGGGPPPGCGGGGVASPGTLGPLRGKAQPMGIDEAAISELTGFDWQQLFLDPLSMLTSMAVNQTPKNSHVVTDVTKDSCREIVRSDGRRDLISENGLKKIMFPFGWTLTAYANGDLKATRPDGSVLYKFLSPEVFQVSLANGRVFNRFQNGQSECQYPDSSVIVLFPNGTIKYVKPDKKEIIRFPDGAIVTRD
eukprot:GHVO01066370.1.p2 GENE.GHVO01066370.1~~GHVO01066370.1.p2  ORF type:complete len:239 (+),score=42.27 GHVO01066370.1:568-1284(+)